MKKQIDKKLGRSIEEYLQLIDKKFEKTRGMHTETPPIFENLTNEEYDFLKEYIKAPFYHN